MKPDRWRRVRALFEEVRPLDRDARTAALDHACGDDAALRAEVESLLTHDVPAPGPVDRPALGARSAVEGASGPPPSLPSPAPAALGSRIGRYELVRIIGAGGMGVVYEARQHEPDRAVALKIVPGGTPGPSGAEAARRLRREAETLARLRHPGIAVVHEAGRTPDGHDWFAMELIEGLELDAWLREHVPPRRDRLELFARIGDAVSAAHQRAIVHRDLKPSNIMVDTTGTPKVLDFGLARHTGPDGRSLVTQPGRLMGTVPYMSPELADASPHEVDVRSDVYALGVILYEMLTGRLPYDLPAGPVTRALRVICERAPVRPSAVDRTLRGDLETILLTALEKDPDDRYASAAALVDDVRRFLAHQPILARPPGAIDQITKLVRRHRLPAALLALLLVAIMAFAAIGTVQAVRLAASGRRLAAQSASTAAALYCSRLARARLLLDAHDLGGMQAVLDACAPDERDWAWRWLRARTDPSDATLTRDGRVVRAVGVQPDRVLLVTYADDTGIEAWDPLAHTAAYTLSDHGAPAPVAAFSPDGRRLATADLAGTIRVRDARTGATAHVVTAFDGMVEAVAFDAAGMRLVALGGRDAAAAPGADATRSSVKMWDLEREALLGEIVGADVPMCFAVAPAGDAIAVGYRAGRVDVVDASTGATTVSFDGPRLVGALAFAPDGSFLLAGLADSTVRRLDLGTGTSRVAFSGHERAVRTVALDPGGLRAASGDAGGVLRVWDVTTGRTLLDAPAHRETAWTVQFAASGTRLVTFGFDGTARLWTVPASATGGDGAPRPDATAFVFDADGRTAIAGTADGRVVRVRLDDPSAATPLGTHDGRVTCLAVAGAGDAVVSGDASGAVRTWPEGPSVHCASPVRAVAMAADGRRAAAADRAGHVRAWRISDAAPVLDRTIPGAAALAFDPGGVRLAVGTEDGAVHLLLPDGPAHVLRGHRGAVHALAWSADGRVLATAGADGAVLVHDAASGARRHVLAHEGPVWSVAFAPDDTRLVTAGRDTAIRIWHAGVGAELLALEWDGQFVVSARFDATGARLVARAASGAVRTWTPRPPDAPDAAIRAFLR